MALSSPAFAADTTSEGRNEEYRKSQQAYRKSLEDSQRNEQVSLEEYRKTQEATRRSDLLGLIITPVFLAAFAVYAISLRRRTLQALALGEQQKKILEEIRDLLKKP
ncbi:MAG TPA: hypothetical protein VFD27_07990 [Chthoniobacteraceae bacterium]|nr:hypothetical protein [Chthoniobacteraceae bacterium]